MSFTSEQLAELEAAIATGATRVRYADREVTYQSLDAMMRLRDRIRAELGLLGDENGRTHRYATHSKGLA